MAQIRLVTKTVEEFAARKPMKIAPITVTPNDTVGYVSTDTTSLLTVSRGLSTFLGKQYPSNLRS